MTSGLSDELGSLKLNDGRATLTTNSTSRRNYATGQNQRHNLRSKRAITVDHDNHEEKLRIVVLGATRVGRYSVEFFMFNILIITRKTKQLYFCI